MILQRFESLKTRMQPGENEQPLNRLVRTIAGFAKINPLTGDKCSSVEFFARSPWSSIVGSVETATFESHPNLAEHFSEFSGTLWADGERILSDRLLNVKTVFALFASV